MDKRNTLKDASSGNISSPRKPSSHVHFDESKDVDSSTRISSSHRYSNSADYSDEFESVTNDSPRTSKIGTHESQGGDYSEDFESDTKISPSYDVQQQGSFDYSEDFETETKTASKHHPKISTLHSVSSEYSDDFESEVKVSPRKKDRYGTPRSVSFSTVTPRHGRRMSSMHSVSSDYSDIDIDSKPHIPVRKGRRPSSHSISSEFSDIDTDTHPSPRHSRKYSTLSSAASRYSSDFETDTFITPQSTSRVHTMTVQYSEDFESDENYSMTTSRAQPTVMSSDSSFDSGEEEAKEDFIKSMVRRMKRPKPTPRKSLQPKQKPMDAETEDRIRQFCQDRIQAMKNKDDKKPKKNMPDSCRLAMRGLTPDTNVCEHGISPTAIARLKIENTLNNLHKAANAKIHEPFKCSHCSDKMANVAAEDFIRKKKALVMKQLVEENMEKFNQQCNDQIYLMSEAIRDLPSTATDPHVITQKLMKPLEDHKEYVVPRQDPQDESGRLFWRTFFSRLKDHPGREYLNLYEDSK